MESETGFGICLWSGLLEVYREVDAMDVGFII